MREGIVWSNDFFVSCQDQSLPNLICIGLRSFVSCITKTTFLHCDLWTLLDTWRLWFYGLFSVHLILYFQILSFFSYLGDFTHRSGNYWATDVDNQKDFQQRVLLLIKHKIRIHLITWRSRQGNKIMERQSLIWNEIVAKYQNTYPFTLFVSSFVDTV